MKKPIVYIACPYTKGDVAVNINNAIKAADEVARHGMIPYVPILRHLYHLISPHPYEFWTENDIEIMLRFDVIYRIQGESSGADHECKVAQGHCIPVFMNIESLGRWYKEKIESSGSADVT